MRNSAVIYRQALMDSRRIIFWWGVGVGAFAFYMVVVFPLLSGLEQITELLESPIFKFALGDMQELSFATLEGFLGIYLFTFVPLMLAIYAVIFGNGIVGREEEKGTLDLLLSVPIARWRVIVEKFGAFIVAALLILLIMLLAVIAAVALTPNEALDTSMLVVASLNVLPVLMLVCALTVFLTTVLRSSAQAGGIAAVIIAASYFINSFAEMVDTAVLNALHYLSFYKYYSPASVMVAGVQWGNVVILLGATMILLALSIFFFGRRDIAV